MDFAGYCTFFDYFLYGSCFSRTCDELRRKSLKLAVGWYSRFLQCSSNCQLCYFDRNEILVLSFHYHPLFVKLLLFPLHSVLRLFAISYKELSGFELLSVQFPYISLFDISNTYYLHNDKLIRGVYLDFVVPEQG